MINLFNDNAILVWGTISAIKVSYVLTRGHLNRLQNSGLNKCQRYDMKFEEGNIIVTSTSYRYCYECATRINLVLDNAKKDLHKDKFVPDVLTEIKKLTTKYSVDEEISSFASFLIKTVFENTKHVTKNLLGLSCAAISLAASQLGKNDNLWSETIPVSSYVLKKNISELQKILIQIRITAFSQNILESRY